MRYSFAHQEPVTQSNTRPFEATGRTTNTVRRRLIRAGLSAIALSLLGVAGTATVGATVSAQTPTASVLTSVSNTTNTNNVIFLTNARRQAAGLRTLRISAQLTNAAQRHSNDQAARQTMSHVGSDGTHGGARITRAGLRWNSWGENVAAGQTSATQVVNAWMASPPHRVNMLNRGFTMIGVGLTVKNGVWYWTLEFAS